MIWLALALGSLGVGLGLVAVFGDAMRDALRAELHRRALDQAFSDGYRAHRDEMERR